MMSYKRIPHNMTSPESFRTSFEIKEIIPILVEASGLESRSDFFYGLIMTYLLHPKKLHFATQVSKLSAKNRAILEDKLIAALKEQRSLGGDYLAERFARANEIERCGGDVGECLACKLISDIISK